MHLSIRPIAAAAFIATALTIAVPTGGYSAAAPRISTGQDLYEACQVLVEHGLMPGAPTPRRGAYCRQFIAGYFATLKYVNADDGAKEALGVPLHEPNCIDIAGPRSYEQLAAKVVRSGEWHPSLLGKPAIELARTAFGSSSPCVK